jgi:Carboxypeptidase regulatory-like domain/TonB-dependent Receptor Plug Domain
MHIASRVVATRALVSAATVVIAAVAPLRAQRRSAVVGTVTDASGTPIGGAQVSLRGHGSMAISDARGVFRLENASLGASVVRVRRLGFRPESLDVQISASQAAAVRLTLVRVAAELTPVIVRASKVKHQARLAGFYDRLERRTSGHFITFGEIQLEDPRSMTHLLQRVPGLTVVRGRGGATGVRMRGRTCWPLVWLDGFPMPAGEVDLDSFAPHSFEGIELYLGSTTPPVRYIQQRTMSSCGTILLWSRSTDMDAPAERIGTSAEVEALVSSLEVFTADQVESAAHLSDPTTLRIEYPPALFASALPGLVIAEYVVDTLGTVEEGTFSIVSSTHPLFSEAVRVALPRAGYVAARRAGHRVRQLVHQPFTFAPPERRGGNRPAGVPGHDPA